MKKVYPYRPFRLRLYEVVHAQDFNLRILAELVDVPYQTILAWNQGRSMPKMGMLLELLKVLNVRFEDLLDASLYQRKF